MIDLHTHSTMSDGRLTPEALAALAKVRGLSAIALTDHDTTRGCERFLEACVREGIRGIAGVELSAKYSPGTMHLLGYMPLEGAMALEPVLNAVQDGRAERNLAIIAALNAHGVPLRIEQVHEKSGDGMVGRPHFAAALVAGGYVKDYREAFRRFLAKGGVAYCERYRLSPERCIQLIHDHGGIVVLAHPLTLKLSRRRLERYVAKLVGYGLDGIEVLYPEHQHHDQDFYRYLVHRYDLVMTGGSDFHGVPNVALQLGRGYGKLHVADHLLEGLDCRLASMAGSETC